MKQYGEIKTKTHIDGHQECGTCHPKIDHKSGRAKARREGKKQVADGYSERDQLCWLNDEQLS